MGWGWMIGMAAEVFICRRGEVRGLREVVWQQRFSFCFECRYHSFGREGFILQMKGDHLVKRGFQMD